MKNLKEKYNTEIAPKLMAENGIKNPMALPRIEKVVLNVGINAGRKDPQYAEIVTNTLARIAGQKSVETKAKKSIASFKIREGMTVGAMLTLRGKRMYDFVEKLINITLPRIRDFRGLDEKNVDQNGNLNLGFKEHIAFPEISSDEVEKIHGLQVTVVTNAASREEGLSLFRLMGFPFKKQETK